MCFLKHVAIYRESILTTLRAGERSSVYLFACLSSVNTTRDSSGLVQYIGL